MVTRNKNKNRRSKLFEKLKWTLHKDPFKRPGPKYNKRISVVDNVFNYLTTMGYDEGDIVMSDDLSNALYAYNIDSDEVFMDMMDELDAVYDMQVYAPEVIRGNGPGGYVHIDDIDDLDESHQTKFKNRHLTPLKEAISHLDLLKGNAPIYDKRLTLTDNIFNFLTWLGYHEGDIVSLDDFCDGLDVYDVEDYEYEDLFEYVMQELEDKYSMRIWPSDNLVGNKPGEYVLIEDEDNV